MSGAMPPILDRAVFQEMLAALPVTTYQAGETVFAAGSRTGRLLILRDGAVVIVKDDVEIATVRSPAPCSANFPSCSTNRTQRTCEPWKPPSFSLPMLRRFSRKTRSLPFTSRQFSLGD